MPRETQDFMPSTPTVTCKNKPYITTIRLQIQQLYCVENSLNFPGAHKEFPTLSQGVKLRFQLQCLCGNSGRKESFPARRGAVTFVLSGAEGARHS